MTPCRPALLLSGLALLLFSPAQAVFADNAYLNHNAVISSNKFDWLYVGYPSAADIQPKMQPKMQRKIRPTSPIVHLIKGAKISNGLFAFNNSQVFVSGGSIDGDLDSSDSSMSTVSAGSVTNLIGEGNSIINLSGGNLDDSLIAYGHTTANISGGHITGDVQAQDQSIVNIRGGYVDNTLYVEGRSTLNLFGTGLQATRSAWGNRSGYGSYTLEGKLADGASEDDKTIKLQESTGARFTLNSPTGTNQFQSWYRGRSSGTSLLSGAVMVVFGAVMAGGILLLVLGKRVTAVKPISAAGEKKSD